MKVSIELDGIRDYDIKIGELPDLMFEGKVLVVTNTKVAGLHLGSLLAKIKAKEVYVVTLSDGEAHKSMEGVERILDAAFNHKLDRSATFIAFGGGVVGDMCGFAAGIFLRGVNYIQIPTTLLSQVDSSVGGKTGVNSSYGKNLIGIFNQPRAVYIDTRFLETLHEREFAAGVAEIIKMATAFDKEFFEWLEHNSLESEQNRKYAIKRSVELKAKVVREDEREQGIRAALNYGHTFAHVIEKETGYKRYLHGEAVGIGMVMANELSMTLGELGRESAERVKKLLVAHNIPISYRIEDIESFYQEFFRDKKSTDGLLSFVVIKEIGRVEIVKDISKNILINVLEMSCLEK